MNIQRMLRVCLVTLASQLPVGAALAQDFPFPLPGPGLPVPGLPGSVPFIPTGPQPGAVPANSEGWRAIIGEYGAPMSGRQAKLVDDAVAELSRGAGYLAPKGGYRGTLLDTSMLNAFAIGDGNVFVTRELLAYMNEEDELIGVLGHEVGHVIGGHGRFAAAANAAQSGSDQLFGVFLPPIRGLTRAAGTAVVRGFDRSQEHAADVAGVKFLADLGRDPDAMGRALGILDGESRLQDKLFGARPAGAFEYWMSDHPIHSERLGMVQLASNLAPRGKPGPHRTPAEFVRELDGMMVDDGPEQGIVDGGHFRHPALKFGLDAPPPFRLLNGTTALLARAPDGSTGTLKMISGGGSAADRFKAAWTKSFPPDTPPPVPVVSKIGGLAVATGSVDRTYNEVPVHLALWLYVWSDTQSFLYAAVDLKGMHTAEHVATAESFRRLSDQEASAVAVRRISIVEIKASDTLASLSQTMAYPDFREERFRLINGIADGAPLPKSGPVKLVVWAAH